jgi:hypothetical protein
MTIPTIAQIGQARKKMLEEGCKPTHVLMNTDDYECVSFGNIVYGLKIMPSDEIKEGTVYLIDADNFIIDPNVKSEEWKKKTKWYKIKKRIKDVWQTIKWGLDNE